MIQDIIREVRNNAQKKLGHLLSGDGLNMESPFAMLNSFPWERYIKVDQEFSQEKLRELNAEFDPRGCFGRMVLGVLLAEKFFPEACVKVAEVIEDAFAKNILQKLAIENDPVFRREMAAELLSYEAPHAVVLVNGEPYEPISKLVGRKILHPCIRSHSSAWAFIAASQVVDEALVEDNIVARLIDLQRADAICPGTALVFQNLISAGVGLGVVEGEKNIEACIQVRPSARIFFLKWKHFGEDKELKEKYPPEVIQLLEEEYQANLARPEKGGK